MAWKTEELAIGLQWLLWIVPRFKITYIIQVSGSKLWEIEISYDVFQILPNITNDKSPNCAWLKCSKQHGLLICISEDYNVCLSCDSSLFKYHSWVQCLCWQNNSTLCKGKSNIELMFDNVCVSLRLQN